MKKYILLILFFGLAGSYHFFPALQPSRKLPDSLIRLNQVLVNQAENASTTFGDYWISEMKDKKALSNVEKQMIQLADKAGIHRLIFGYGSSVRITYFTDYFYYYLTDRYYVYSSDGYTEETQVSSIEQAVEQLENKSIYHFCEPVDHPNWFLCVSQD